MAFSFSSKMSVTCTIFSIHGLIVCGESQGDLLFHLFKIGVFREHKMEETRASLWQTIVFRYFRTWLAWFGNIQFLDLEYKILTLPISIVLRQSFNSVAELDESPSFILAETFKELPKH